MATVKVMVIKEGVTHNGGPVAVGETIELGELSGHALVREGFAELEGQKIPEAEQEPEADPAYDLAKLRAALDGQYTLDGGSKPSLKDAALKAGVDYAYDAKKGDIIQAAIDQGKAELLLQ